ERIPNSRGENCLESGVLTQRHGPPRSRGENRLWRAVVDPSDGPPPLARGEQHPAGLDEVQGRTTPARAGRTPRGRPGRRSRPDHPRSRGENKRRDAVRRAAGGPPPLARGEPPPAPS